MAQLTFFFMLEPLLINNLYRNVETPLPVLAAVHDAKLTRTQNFIRENLIKLEKLGIR